VDSSPPQPRQCRCGPPVRPTDHARSLLHRTHVHLGVAAVVMALAVGVAAAATTAAGDPFARGLLAGLGTLAGCLGLLGAGGAVLRSRLDAHDHRRWDGEWARVEPLWSERRG
jgi:hypothetical protein